MSEIYQPGNIITVRNREWIVLPESNPPILHLRPLGGAEADRLLVHTELEKEAPHEASFPPPDPEMGGNHLKGQLFRDAARLVLRTGSGPFRCFGNLNFAPRAYQLVPLLMAMKLENIRLLIADDVGIGKTIEAGIIVRELWDRGEIQRFCVLCPPHLCEQWQDELREKFGFEAEVVTTGTAARLERGIPVGSSLFDFYPVTVISLDYIKSPRRKNSFIRHCPEMVIVEEAHSSVGHTGQKHQRYSLLKNLAENRQRHFLFLTATPHSGDEHGFYNLLALLHPDFSVLSQMESLDSRFFKSDLRQKLGHHLVQRRRPDIEEWRENQLFPEKLSTEIPYRLSGEWKSFFDDILKYARQMVKSVEGESEHKKRLTWWSVLALLRCVSSSPKAAETTLQTRLNTENADLQKIDEIGFARIYDGDQDYEEINDDLTPGARLENSNENVQLLESFKQKAINLQGASDPKLQKLLTVIKELLTEKYRPIVFCRYINTAKYLREQLGVLLKKTEVLCITGEDAPEQRRETVESINTDSDHKMVLVATDCLSEGINLQDYFNAVIHYDLAWNPTRHEQREGRIDRYGQSSKTVKTVMFYGENNPIDGVVLKVILRKAEKIRRELGISVPIPEDTRKVDEAIMESIIFREHSTPDFGRQRSLAELVKLSGKKNKTADPEKELEDSLEILWKNSRDKAEKNHTIFAQRRLKPEDVIPQWRKTIDVLGGVADVERFFTNACTQLKYALSRKNIDGRDCYILHMNTIGPGLLKEKLQNAGYGNNNKNPDIIISLEPPAPAGGIFIHRTHPLVFHFADTLLEQCLKKQNESAASRCSAIFSPDCEIKTVLFLLRLRCRIQATVSKTQKILLAEECVCLKWSSAQLALIGEAETAEIMALKPGKNMDDGVRKNQIEKALVDYRENNSLIEEILKKHAEEILKEHINVREASDSRGRYVIKPSLPADLLGVFVLVPDRG